MQCWGLPEANEQKWKIQHCTGGVGALCKHPYAKCPNSFDNDCLRRIGLVLVYGPEW